MTSQAFGHGGETIVQGSLAESWEIPEPTKLIFTMRRDAHWHDIPPLNGRVATAQDVDFSTTRQIAEGTNAGAFAGLASQEVVDDFTFSMTLDQVNVDFLLGLADARNSVVSPDAVDAGGGDLEKGPPIGTGAWLFDEWVRDVNFLVKRNPAYHRGRNPLRGPDRALLHRGSSTAPGAVPSRQHYYAFRRDPGRGHPERCP